MWYFSKRTDYNSLCVFSYTINTLTEKLCMMYCILSMLTIGMGMFLKMLFWWIAFHISLETDLQSRFIRQAYFIQITFFLIFHSKYGLRTTPWSFEMVPDSKYMSAIFYTPEIQNYDKRDSENFWKFLTRIKQCWNFKGSLFIRRNATQFF